MCGCTAEQVPLAAERSAGMIKDYSRVRIALTMRRRWRVTTPVFGRETFGFRGTRALTWSSLFSRLRSCPQATGQPSHKGLVTCGRLGLGS